VSSNLKTDRQTDILFDLHYVHRQHHMWLELIYVNMYMRRKQVSTNMNIYKTNIYRSTEDEQLENYVIRFNKFNLILNDSLTNKHSFINSDLLVDCSNCTYLITDGLL